MPRESRISRKSALAIATTGVGLIGSGLKIHVSACIFSSRSSRPVRLFSIWTTLLLARRTPHTQVPCTSGALSSHGKCPQPMALIRPQMELTARKARNTVIFCPVFCPANESRLRGNFIAQYSLKQRRVLACLSSRLAYD